MLAATGSIGLHDAREELEPSPLTEKLHAAQCCELSLDDSQDRNDSRVIVVITVMAADRIEIITGMLMTVISIQSQLRKLEFKLLASTHKWGPIPSPTRDMNSIAPRHYVTGLQDS